MRTARDLAAAMDGTAAHLRDIAETGPLRTFSDALQYDSLRWADTLDEYARDIECAQELRDARWDDDSEDGTANLPLTQAEQNRLLLQMMTLFETARLDLATASQAMHFAGCEKLRDKWQQTAEDLRELLETTETGLDVVGKGHAATAAHRLRRAQGVFTASVLLKRDLLRGDIERGVVPLRAGSIVNLSDSTTWPGMMQADNTIETGWKFWTTSDIQTSLIFDEHSVAIMRLRDNLTTRAHFAGAPLARAPFAVKWMPEGLSLF